MSLEVRNLIALVATLGVGLLAGIMVGTGLAQLSAKALQADAWVMRFQLEDSLFARTMPPLMLGTLIALITASALSRGTSRWAFASSTALMLVVLVVTVKFEVPLNKQIQSWSAAVPPHWRQTRDLWLQRHLVRTVAAALAFVSALIAVVF